MNLEPIAHLQSPFKQRFGIPRQPGLVNAKGTIIFQPGFDDPVMLDGLEAFSHIWVSFIFHANIEQGWKKKVKPPRLGGKKQVGVFASRSPHRPNFLGLSVLKLDEIQTSKPVSLRVSGLDILDQTPIIDIKPYVAYSDSIADASSSYASNAPIPMQQVTFDNAVISELMTNPDGLEFKQLIEDVLAQDPRPAYKTSRFTERDFGMVLGDYEVKWRVEDNMTRVVALNMVI